MKITLVTKTILSLMISVCVAAGFSAMAASVTADDVEPIGVLPDTSSQPSMKSVDDGLKLTAAPEEPSVFMIYSITGQLVKNIRVDAGESKVVALKGGCYVVRCEAWVKKIALR